MLRVCITLECCNSFYLLRQQLHCAAADEQKEMKLNLKSVKVSSLICDVRISVL